MLVQHSGFSVCRFGVGAYFPTSLDAVRSCAAVDPGEENSWISDWTPVPAHICIHLHRHPSAPATHMHCGEVYGAVRNVS